MGTDGQMDGQTNKQTNKYLLKYSGINSHSLMGVRIERVEVVVKGRIRFERVGDIKVVKRSVKIKCYESVWSMFDRRQYI
jgi:hypothetical protein